jgi:putative transcriptional regulator
MPGEATPGSGPTVKRIMHQFRQRRRSYLHNLIPVVAVLLCFAGIPLYAQDSTKQPLAQDSQTNLKKGTFLVATDNLAGSSFEETVILVTNYSKQGTVGIAINRPTTLTLKEAFPEDKHFEDKKDELYLGGPVRPDSLFVLMKTKHPEGGMQHIAADVYFSAGIAAMVHDIEKNGGNLTARAFAGYSGWAAGQLEEEIQQGDWLVINADMNIIFSNSNNIWQKLHRAWSGTWI